MLNNKSIIKNSNTYFYIFVLLLITLTLFTVVRFPIIGDDMAFHYYRFKNLVEALNNGVFPAYLSPGIENYGYATKLFYPDFILIPFAYIGTYIGTQNSFKLIYFTITIICGFISFISLKNILNDKIASYIGAILYTFCFYRLQDLYHRAALGEVITFTFIPLIFWGLYEIIRGDYRKWYLLCIGFSLCLLSHVLSSFLALIVSFIIVISQIKYFIKEPKRIVALTIAALISLLLTAYFIYPYLEQILSNSFNYEIFTIDKKVTIPAQRILMNIFTLGSFNIINFVPAIGITLSLPLFFRYFISEKTVNIKIADYSAILGIVLIIICFDYFNPLYKNIKILGIIQFMWRFFEFSSFFLALACSVYISSILIRSKKSIVLLSIIVSFIIITIYIFSNACNLYLYDTQILSKLDTDKDLLVTNNYYQGASINSEYYPQSLSIKDVENRGVIVKNLRTTTLIDSVDSNSQGIKFNVQLTENEILELPKVYYKGYKANLNGKEIPITQSKNGFIEVRINESGEFNLDFSGTFLQKNSIYMTLLGFLFLSIYIIWSSKKSKTQNALNE